MPRANETKITGNGPFLVAPRSGSRTNATIVLEPGPFPRGNVTRPGANGTWVEAPGQGPTGIVEGLDENVEELDENVEGTEATVEGTTAIGRGTTRPGQGGSGTVEGTRGNVERPGRNGTRPKTNVDFQLAQGGSRDHHAGRSRRGAGSSDPRREAAALAREQTDHRPPRATDRRCALVRLPFRANACRAPRAARRCGNRRG